MSEPADVLDTSRRKSLFRVMSALGGLAATLVAVPVLGFLVSPLRRREELTWRAIGRLDALPIGKTVRVIFDLEESPAGSGATAKGAAWVRRLDAERVDAFSIHCTHTGCPVDWVEGAQLFLCPCHGGSFGPDGEVRGGPPPSPLPRHEVRVQDGLVQLRPRPLLPRV
jgi:menaquinol-cytochrome c reductase iron-sulfur subunit